MFATPDDLIIKTVLEKGKNFGKYELGPLPKGYGHTIGNALRRTLLSSIKGFAATELRIDGVSHQFTTIKGVKEDVVNITLNLKQLRVKLLNKESEVIKIAVTGPLKLTAGDLEVPEGVEVINKDLVIATLADKSTKLNASILIESGFGYVPVEDRKTTKVGVIVLDSIFTPVLNVLYSVEPDRLGQKTGLDKVVIEIKTDGTVPPKEALTESASLLKSFFSRVSLGKETVKEAVVEEKQKNSTLSYNPKDVYVEELHLPTRTINALKKAGVKTLQDLAKMTNEDLLKIRNLGEESIKEIDKLLKKETLR